MRNFDGILGKGESKRKGGIELEIVYEVIGTLMSACIDFGRGY